MATRREILEAELVEKMFELQNLEDVESGIIPLEDYTDEQKLKFFDNFYTFAKSHIDEVQESGYVDEDSEHWFFEEGLKILNINDVSKFWKYYNSLSE